MLVRQLEEELRLRMRQPNLEMQQQMEAENIYRAQSIVLQTKD